VKDDLKERRAVAVLATIIILGVAILVPILRGPTK
jgi:hypothetical protein